MKQSRIFCNECKGRIFWDGPGLYASKIETDTNMEVFYKLDGNEEAWQMGLSTPFWLDSVPPNTEILVK